MLAALLMGLPLAAEDPSVAFRFEDPAIVESSGLAVVDGEVVTVNDSGDRARVFVVSARDGRTVRTASWSGNPRDVEALAPAGDGAVWVGDIGDNLEARDAVTVTRLSLDGGSSSYQLTYPDGAHDAEALLAHPRSGRLYVVTKGFGAGTVYAAPPRLTSGSNELVAVGSAPGLVTDGAFLPSGDHVVLRNYGVATVLAFPSLEEVGRFLLPRQRQGEGLAALDATTVLVSSEGAGAEVWRVPLPDDVAAVVAPGARPSVSPSVSPSATPSATPSAPDPSTSEPDVTRREPWPWVAGGLLGLACLVVLLRSLRPR